ncbi:hypothetical protein EFV10_24770 [Escherichia coli]|nr:hypothetical protein AW081_22120 [Escherichia coli]RNI76190.1 hypothetical protein EFV10_24770 [Escherichia coli]RNJ28841.1 hypothetical protein EFV02_24800 [Escherichia coli]
MYHHAHGAGCLPVSSVSAPEPALDKDKGCNQTPVADMPLRSGGFTMPVSFNKLPAKQTTVNRLNCETFKIFGA